MRPAVLVVEDCEDTRELLGEYLMNEGYHSVMARSGADALKRLREIQADVIVTDLHMPEMDGVAFIAEVRKLEAFQATPIILLTASVLEQARGTLEAASVSVERILTKPIALERLVDAIEAVLPRGADGTTRA